MDDLETLIFQAWEKIQLKIANDPDELQRRLALRTRPAFRRPVRPWCLALRASDRRIADYFGWRQNWQGYTGPQHIDITAHLLRKLTMPLMTDRPYTVESDMACRLGRSRCHMYHIAKSSVFQRRHKHLLGGIKAHVPVVYSDKLLDPTSKNLAMPHPAWSTHHAWLCERIPEDFTQTIPRVPIYRAYFPRYATGPRQRPHDPLSRNWTRDGQYIPAHWELKRDHINARQRARYREQRLLHDLATDKTRGLLSPLPPLSPSPGTLGEGWGEGYSSRGEGDLSQDERDSAPHSPLLTPHSSPRPIHQFSSWSWLCPKCNRTARLLYLPIFAVKAFNLLGDADPPIGSEFGMPTHDPRFLCARCHNVNFPRTSRASSYWDLLITHISGGLLRGAEIPRPAWLPRKTSARTKRRIVRREELLRRLLLGQSIVTIARELDEREQSLRRDVRLHIYPSAGVKSLRALRAAHNIPPPQNPTRTQILTLMTQGLRTRQIAEQLALTINAVQLHQRRLYRQHNVHSRHDLLAKLANTPHA